MDDNKKMTQSNFSSGLAFTFVSSIDAVANCWVNVFLVRCFIFFFLHSFLVFHFLMVVVRRVNFEIGIRKSYFKRCATFGEGVSVCALPQKLICDRCVDSTFYMDAIAIFSVSLNGVVGSNINSKLVVSC